MKTKRFIKTSAAAIIIISMLFIAFASRASDLSTSAYKKNYTHIEEFQNVEIKG